MSERNAEDAVLDAALAVLRNTCHSMSVGKGFYDGPQNFGERIALVHSELSEALEADHAGNPASEKPIPLSGVEEELADTFIRLLDMCGWLNYDVGFIIRTKLQYNATRPFKHNKQY